MAKWSDATFAFIKKYAEIFRLVADQIPGMTPERLAGAMAKENNAVRKNLWWEEQKDYWTLFGGDEWTGPYLRNHEWWLDTYNRVVDAGVIDDATIMTKVEFKGLMDLGPFNAQSITSIFLLMQYKDAHPNDDPLNLKYYVDHLDAFMLRLL